MSTISDPQAGGLSHPPAPALIYTLDEICRALGMSADTFRRLRPQLEAKGFPKRLPALGARWSRVAVDAWIADPVAPRSAGRPTRAAQAEAVITQAQAQLEARYGGGRR